MLTLSNFFNKRGQEISYTYNEDGKLTTKTTPDGFVNFVYDDRDRIQEIVGDGFHYVYKHGHGDGLGTMYQQEDLVSGKLFQTWHHDVYGGVVDVYDNLNWHKHFLYDSPVLADSPNEVDYMWAGTEASFMRNKRKYNAARRLTYKTNDMIKRWDGYSYDSNGLFSSPGGIASLDASPSLGIVMLRSRYGNQSGGWPYFTESGNLTFTRDISGLIGGITGDKEFNANYDPDLQITAIGYFQPQPFPEGYACNAFSVLVFVHPTLSESLWEAMGGIASFAVHS
jgi:YD repeat-containing protein